MGFLVNLIEMIQLFGVARRTRALLYISRVEVPAVQDLAISDKLVNWHRVFPKAMSALKTYGMIILLFLLVMVIFRFHIG